jgi:N-acetylglucosaminyl-diphospho-decaprenol L-rhamnosyltransferase
VSVTVDVVVVTWRARERVLRCLELLAAEAPPHRLIVVDNASGDGTAESTKARFAAATVVEMSTNRGFAAAANAGVARGDGEAIVLVNDDVEIEPGFVAAIVAPLRDDPECGMVAGLLLMPENGLVDGFGIELDTTLAPYNRLRREPPTAKPGRLAMPSGGAAAYRRTAFDAAGGFDERLFGYGEDVDLGLRLHRAGWMVAAAPDACGVHLGGASFGVDSPLQVELAGFARGFVLARYGVLRSRAAPRALLFEALVVGYGLVRRRSLAPLRSRLRGYRAAGHERLAVPAAAVEPAIAPREALRRLRHTR